MSIARREGPVRLVAVTRVIADSLGGDKRRFSFGGGGTLRFGRFIALAGDAATLTNRASAEKIAWSAGLHIALPNTPHTLSLHVSNASTSTMQGLARGGDTKRYGFEFTIPIHVGRFFSTPEATTGAAEAPASLAIPAARDSVVATTPTPAPVSVPVKPTPTDTVPTKAAERAAPPTPAPTRAATPSTATRAAAPKIVNARMKGQAFIPDRIEIAAGSTVLWKNSDALIHTVTAVDKSFNSGTIGADGTYSRTFNNQAPTRCTAWRIRS